MITSKQNLLFLSDGAKQLGLELDSSVLEKLLNYVALLEKWNRSYNLSAIRDPREMLTWHILDSLSIAPYLRGKRIIDVGSGAGLPGIPLALCFPQTEFTLLDSNGKKTRFLIQALAELAIPNASVLQARVEALPSPLIFDCVVSRAFAPLNAMTVKVQHLCAAGGRILAMQGVYPNREELDHLSDWKITIEALQVPSLNAERHIVIAERGRAR